MPRWLVVLGVAVCCGCDRGPQDPFRLVVAVPSGPGTPSPNMAHDGPTVSVLNNVYETLVEVDANLVLRPGLAESWHTPDDTTWMFRLRTGVRCHDGRLLEAADVAQSLDHARVDPGSARRGLLAGVRSIEAADRQTVVLRTTRPVDTLATRLASVFVWAPPARSGEPGVGTGPYRIRSWAPSGDTVLEAVLGHRSGSSHIPVVTFRAIADARERVKQLVEGSVDLVVDPALGGLADLGNPPKGKILSRSGLRTLFVGMDSTRERTPYVDSKTNPFRDRTIRQAVALAIDRRRLVAGPLSGAAEVIDQVASPDELGAFRDSIPVRPYDPPAAGHLLSRSSHPQGFQLTLDFASSPDTDAVTRALAGDLARIRIRMALRPASEADLLRRVERRDTSFYIMAWNSETGDGRLSYESLLHSAVGGRGHDNGGGYSNPAMDKLIESGLARLTHDERRLLLARLATKVALDVPIVPLVRSFDRYAVAEGLQFTPRLDRRIRAADVQWKTR